MGDTTTAPAPIQPKQEKGVFYYALHPYEGYQAAKDAVNEWTDVINGKVPAPVPVPAANVPAPAAPGPAPAPAPVPSPSQQDTSNVPAPAPAAPEAPPGNWFQRTKAKTAELVQQGKDKARDFYGNVTGGEDEEGGSLGGVKKAFKGISDFFGGDGFNPIALIIGIVLIAAALFMGGSGFGALSALGAGAGVFAVGKQVMNKVKESSPHTHSTDSTVTTSAPSKAPTMETFKAQLGEQNMATIRQKVEADFKKTDGIAPATLAAVENLKQKYDMDGKTATAIVSGLLTNEPQWEKQHQSQIAALLKERGHTMDGNVQNQLNDRLDIVMADLTAKNPAILTQIKSAGSVDDAVAAATTLYFKPPAAELPAKAFAGTIVASNINAASLMTGVDLQSSGVQGGQSVAQPDLTQSTPPAPAEERKVTPPSK